MKSVLSVILVVASAAAFAQAPQKASAPKAGCCKMKQERLSLCAPHTKMAKAMMKKHNAKCSKCEAKGTTMKLCKPCTKRAVKSMSRPA